MNHETRIIQCILSILYTINNVHMTNSEIEQLNKILIKLIRNETLADKDRIYLKEQTYKYSMFINQIVNEGNENRIGKIAIMNDLCYNYYKTESEILLLQNKDINRCVKQINIINKDIEQFNKYYDNEKFLNKIELKYNNFVSHFFNIINMTCYIN